MSESSGSGLADRGTSRRWLISAAIVVLLHAGLAVGVLTWRNMRAAPPIEIDLTPSPAASGRNEAQAAPPTDPEQASPAPSKTESAAAGDQAAPLDSAPRQSPSEVTSPAEQSRVNQNTAEAGPGIGPGETAPGTTAPQLPPVLQGADAERARGPGGVPPAINPRIGSATVTAPMASAPAPGGLTAGESSSPKPSSPNPSSPKPSSAKPSSPMANMPLDTSITVQPPVHGNGAIGPLASRETGSADRVPTSEFRPAKPFGVPDIPRNSAHSAQGAHVQDRARAAIARSIGRAGTTKNAIGSSTTVMASRGDTAGLNAGVTRNAIGVTANFRPRIPRANTGDNKIGVSAVAGSAMPTAPVINGHGFARSTVGPAMIGGPARASGALSGNDFHLRHR